MTPLLVGVMIGCGALIVLAGVAVIVVGLYMVTELSRLRVLDVRMTSMETYLKDIADAPDRSSEDDAIIPTIAMFEDDGTPLPLNDVLYKLMNKPSDVTADQRKMVQSMLEEFLDQLKGDTDSFDFNAEE